MVVSNKPSPPVATNSGINPRNICLPPKTAVPLHSHKLINSINIKIKNLKIMTQKNEMSARALTMDEMENVNGGVRITTGGGRCYRKPKK